MTLLKTLKLWVFTALLLCALPVDARREATPLLNVANETSLTLSTYSLDLYPNTNGVSSPSITFADPEVERICVAQWDTDGDGQLSQAEAAAVTSIANVFQGNSSITSFDELRFFTGLTTIDDFAFYNCASLTSVKFPTGVTEIGESAFAEDANLKEALLPSGVRTISKMAFFRCRNLANVTLPNGLATIGANAFFYCDNLKSVTIPASVTSIGEGAFAMLATRPDVYCRATTPPTAAADAFNYSTARGTLHVPMGCADSYHNAEGWKAFENIVEMEDGVWCPTIIVTTLDGATVEYLIDKNTKVKIAKPDLVIETDGMVLTYELENMSQVRYGKKFVSMGIPVVSIAKDEPFKMENETLFLSGLSENTLVGIYNVEGKTVMSRRYSGKAQVSLKGLPSGVYFVKFNNETYKILKK
ncbi:MAG: leucine-rich repeat domain-containing protein [Prevotella sp.]|nr:leucine-rich repeat domain-containing protein [Prevotella sp.]